MYKWLKNCGKAGCAGHQTSFGDKEIRKRADARVGHQTLFGDKKQGRVLMHA